MAKWYVIRKGKEHGPFNDAQMREFATEGKLKEHYQVRRSGDAATYPVADLERLLGSAHENTPPIAASGLPRKRTWKHRLLLPAAVLSAGLVAIVAIGVVFAVKESSRASEILAKANKAWEAGDKQAALQMYRDLAKQGIAFIPPKEQAMVLGRAIDADSEGGDPKSLESLLEVAVRRNIKPDASSPKAQAALKSAIQRAEQDAQVKAVAGTTADIPDFSTVDYTYDFSTVDYATIPPQCQKDTRELREDDGIYLCEGYVKPDGEFVTHGRRQRFSEPSQNRGGKAIRLVEGFHFHGKAHGNYTYRDEEGNLSSTCMFVEGKRHGIEEFRYPSGQKKSRTPYFHGNVHGVLEQWHETGESKLRKTFVEGKRQGVALEWYPNGQKAFEAIYVNDLAHGPYRMWFDDGSIEEEFHYSDGTRVGRWTQYEILAGNKVLCFDGAMRSGQPAGAWKVGVIVAGQGHQVIEVDADKPRRGSRKQFLAKLKLCGWVIPDTTYQEFLINVPQGVPSVAGIQTENIDAVLNFIGQPSLDIADPDSPSSPAAIRLGQGRRLWRYDCDDGNLVFQIARNGGVVRMNVSWKLTSRL
jgi:antitoxin component YwqK of YwqJK toxin-antitoxin module